MYWVTQSKPYEKFNVTCKGFLVQKTIVDIKEYLFKKSMLMAILLVLPSVKNTMFINFLCIFKGLKLT